MMNNNIIMMMPYAVCYCDVGDEMKKQQCIDCGVFLAAIENTEKWILLGGLHRMGAAGRRTCTRLKL
jgi:hypothetical protein